MQATRCSIDGCTNGGRLKRGWCGMHYQRWRKTGDPLRVIVPQHRRRDDSTQCAIEGCETTPVARGWCVKHYTRWARTGDPTVSRRAERDPVCTVQGCHGRHYCLSYCRTHYERWRRLGDAAAPVQDLSGNAPWVTYGSAHDRVRAAKGPATSHACIDCGGAAQEWSYSHNSSREMTAEVPFWRERILPIPYSPDPDDYEPRCRSCHVRFDRWRWRWSTDLRDIAVHLPTPTRETK